MNARIDPTAPPPEQPTPIPTFHTPQLAERKRDKIVAIKMHCGILIDQHYPDWKQRNDLMDPAERGASQRQRWVKDMRAFSNKLEADIVAATTEAELDGVRIETGWPEP